MSQNPPASGTSDINLLFGIVAMQMDFVRRDELIAAMNAWVLDKSCPLGAILCAQGVLTEQRRALLDALVGEHVRQHGNDPKQSLAAIGGSVAAPEGLRHILDEDLDRSCQELTRSVGAEPAAAPLPPRRTGGVRYRILRSHAQGGLGEVFVAEDVELHREVALKEIQSHRADDPGSRTRFVLEAEITGGLEHPGIIPVYGLGTYPNGRPFYAMRFIRGESFQAAIDQFHQPGTSRSSVERRLAFRELLGRFIDVCNAIAYAHSRGVIHRDLKPANVMLGRYGETLVVDWGLAKAGVDSLSNHPPADEPTTDPVLIPASGSGHPVLTQAGSAMGTPTYMSPEQAAGRIDEVGPASDVYSLGAILYTILTGKKAFEGDTVQEILDRVKAGQFPKPRAVKRDAPAPLEAVCLKAMSLNRTDRFATATALGVEVEHWLADEPTAVYRDPWTVRLFRWSRRHRTGVAAGVVFLVCSVVALSVGAALIWREEQRTAAQQRIAVENYQLSSELSSRAIDLIATSEAEFATNPAQNSARGELLKAASRSFQQQLHNRPDDDLKRRAAQVYRYTANFYRLRGSFDEADGFFSDAAELLRELIARDGADDSNRVHLAELLRDQARVRSDLGRLKEAQALLAEAIEIAQALATCVPIEPAHQRLLAMTLLNAATLERNLGNRLLAATLIGRSISLFRSLLGSPPQSAHPYDSVLLAGALNLTATLDRETGRMASALQGHLEALELLKSIAEKRLPGSIQLDVLHFLSLCRLEQARTVRLNGEAGEVIEKTLTTAIKQWEKLIVAAPKVFMYPESRAIALRTRGEVRAESMGFAEAMEDLEQSRQALELLFKEYPGRPRVEGELGRTCLELGSVAIRRGEVDRAKEWFGRAETHLREALRRSPDGAEDRQSLDRLHKLQSK